MLLYVEIVCDKRRASAGERRSDAPVWYT